MDDLAVRLADVHAVYEGERHATLRGVSLDVPVGTQLAVTGPNGSGKTTLLEIINGLLPISSGDLFVFGQMVTPRSHRIRSEIAYVPQNLFFDPETPFLTFDVVLAARFGLSPAWRLPSRDDRSLARDALQAVGMDWAERRPVGRLSGGQQRKVLLARSLAQQTRLLLLDEPTANLDPQAREDVASLVAVIREELHATAIVVSHEGGPLLDASDTAIVLADGRIAETPPYAVAERSIGGT